MSTPTAEAAGPAPNRLACETSPYLLQHAHNPVDWYPWGEEAFAKARADDKPVFLSVGYATCHWCHVMERESFEDGPIARQLADGFIAIKVDREELPDVDQVYMRALQALSGRGGWPMNLFLTPQRLPFFGGIYFPPTSRPGATGFPEVLTAVAEAWRDRRGGIEQQARALMARIDDGRPLTATPAEVESESLHAGALAQIADRFDAVHGGFGGAPKFPQAPLLNYLVTLAAGGDRGAGDMLLASLHAMAAGGLCDQVGGGFARYATDSGWQVPHFEKMLYDNAQLARVYTGAFRLTGDERLRVVAEDTLEYLLREMHPAASPSGFSSAQDADAEGVEGKFHVWTLSEFEAVLGADAAASARLFGVSAEGNWPEPGQPARNVLQRREAAAVQAHLGLDDAGFYAWERSVRERLRAARARRVWPTTDDKVLADWNGMVLRALAEAGRLLGRDDFVRAASGLADFLLTTMVRDGRVHHAWRNGSLRSESYLADQAQLGLGLVELHAATGETRWLTAASGITVSMLRRFHAEGVGFFDSESAQLPMRARELHDGAVPSGTGAACELLLRLAGAVGRSDWHDTAVAALQSNSGVMAASAVAVPSLLHARLLADHGVDLAVPGGPGGEGLWEFARSAWAPLFTLIGGPPEALPLLEGRVAGAAYPCRHGSCELPPRSVDELQARLAQARVPAPPECVERGISAAGWCGSVPVPVVQIG